MCRLETGEIYFWSREKREYTQKVEANIKVSLKFTKYTSVVKVSY